MARASALAKVATADLDITVFGQLALAELPLGNTFEAGSLEVVGFNAALRGRPLW